MMTEKNTLFRVVDPGQGNIVLQPMKSMVILLWFQEVNASPKNLITITA